MRFPPTWHLFQNNRFFVLTLRGSFIQFNIRKILLNMTHTANVTSGTNALIKEAQEHVAHHKAKAKFWRYSAIEDGDSHSEKLASDHERFHRAWLKELESLQQVAHG